MKVGDMEKTDFIEESITISNIDDYKDLIDSIRYICDFNGYDRDFDYREDVENPGLPEDGKPENNYLVGFKEKTTGKAIVFTEYYEGFMSDDVVFLGEFYEHAAYHGKGYGKAIYHILEQHWKERGFTRCVLNVDLKNTAAILFWIKMGFKNIDSSFVCNETEREKYYMLRLSKEI